MTITGQQPSGTAKLLTDSFTFSGQNSPNGSLFDTARTYTPTASQLASLTPKAKQGYHIRVEVAANDHHAKTHVIWVEPCTVAPGISGLSASRSDTPGSGGSSPLPARPTAAASYSPALLTPSAVDASPAAVAAADTLRATVPADVPDAPSSGLAFTGYDVLAALAAAALLSLLGAGFVVLSSRAKRVHI